MSEDYAEMRLLRVQAQTMPAILLSLVQECRRRFVSAAQLLDLQEERFAYLHRPGGDEVVEIAFLQGLYEVLMGRYIREVHDAQIAIHEPAEDLEVRRWTQYAYWALIPRIAGEDSMARNVMRAIGAHPCPDRRSAHNALVDAAVNMTMPPMPKPAPQWPR